ncbi:MAG: efflux RND transporter permease subunit [Nitrospinae bacterium]|nr:efflux RND transporter permease subunit [Nitrospinota bacterium]
MVKAALRTPYTVIVAALVLIVVGLFSITRLPLDILPTFRLPAVMVVTTYTGMPSKMIEMDITNRLERWLSQASGLDHIESRSLGAVSILNCYFQPGFDPNNALAQIGNFVASDLHYLPPGTLPPIVMAYDPTANLPAAQVSVYTPNMDEAKMWDESNYIVRTQLNAVPGAVAPVVFGGKLRQIMVYLNKNALVGHGLSPLDVVDALKTGNAMIPTGDARIGNLDLGMTSNGMVPTLEDFDKLPIRVSGDAPVFVKDIGRTADASAVQTNVVQINGVKQMFIPIFRRVGSNTLAVVDGIKNKIPKVLTALPDGTQIKLLFDQSIKVREAVYDVIRELILGVILASLVIYFFLGSFRPTFIAGLAIPISIVGCMAGLYFSDQSLNLMTLGGLALVTGPLIDMAVVVLENIERHLETGQLPFEAAEIGASEVALPVLVSALALIIVFFPVVFFQGLGKFLFTPLAVAVGFAVIISYFTAMTVAPLAASRFFKSKEAERHEKKGLLVRIFTKGYERFRRGYDRMLANSLKKPRLVVTFVGLFFVVSMALIPLLGSEFFPVTDHGQFYIRMRAKTGLKMEKTSELVGQVSDTIHNALPKGSVGTILSNAGVLSSWAAAYTPNSATHEALMEVEMNMEKGVGAEGAIRTIRAELARQYPDVSFSFSMIDPVASALNYGALSPVNLKVSGPDLQKAHDIADDLLAKIKKVPGITDSFVEQELDYPSIHIEVDRTKAAYVGLTTDAVIKNVITALNSSVLFSPNFWDDPVSGNNYYIGAIYPEEDVSMESISNIPINPGAGGKWGKAGPTLLRNIATLTPEKIPVQISHVALQRTIDVMANVSGRDIGSVASDIDKILAKTSLPKRYAINWSGAVENMRSSFGNLGGGIALALILIFLLMVAQLKSFMDPLVVLATVPAAFIGVVWTLFLTGTTLNIQSLMGVIMLIGIIVSNSVILTDFANQRLKSGVSPSLAMRDAGIVRLRPILMTAISTVMALLPSAMSGANAPLARAVIGGLLSGTFMTLLFLPSLYVLVKSEK